MKNKFLAVTSLLISFLFILLLFSGCNKEIKVTEENVKEIALPTIESDFYLSNSYFYDIEKEANGTPVYYPTDSSVLFKITTKTTLDELNKSVAKYRKGVTASAVSEKDGALYAVDPIDSMVETMLDTNSIRLVKQDGDIYYIAVDQYMYIDGKENEDGSPNYINTITYKMKSVDGVLQIQEEPEVKEETPKNTAKDLSLIGSFDKFFGAIKNR